MTDLAVGAREAGVSRAEDNRMTMECAAQACGGLDIGSLAR